MMLENSTYSVISPEGCAAILWKDQTATKQAAAMLKLTAKDMLNFNVIDKIIHEPKDGAQNDPQRMIKILKDNLIMALLKLDGLSGQELKIQRANKFEVLGFFES
jgi:acetyl-CoA carboxylase carboxyl transferase subunit alpha